MKPNPRLIPINKGAIRTITSTFCYVIAREAKLYLKEHPEVDDTTPLALLEDRFYANRTFEVENHRTKRGFDLHLRAEEAGLSEEELDALLVGAELSCSSDIMGGHLAVSGDVHLAYQQKMVVNLCPVQSIGGLTNVDNAYDAAAFQNDLFSLLLHEMTHASEHGLPKGYKTIARDAPEDVKGTEAEYQNHPWEVRANARQIANAVVTAWRNGLRPRGLRRSTGEVRKLLDAGATVENVLEAMRWGEIDGFREEARFQRAWEHYTPANRRKLLQLIVRQLQEENLI